MALLRRRNAEDYCREAQLRSKARDYAGSLAAADRAIAIAPQAAMAYHLRGCALSDLGQHGSALHTFRQAIALDPAMTYVQYRIALELEFLDMHGEALEAVDAAMGMDPDDTAPRILRGAILFDLERYEDALQEFSLVLQREPGFGHMHLNRARVLRRLGRYPEALAGYDHALQLARRLPDVREQIAILHEQKAITLALAGEYDNALTEFGTAAAESPGRPDGTAYVWSAAIAWHHGDPREARRRFGQAAGKPVGMVRCESVNMQAMVSCALGRVDRAADLLGPGYSVDPGVQDVLSALYHLLSEPPMPGIDQLRAVALGPGSAAGEG